LSVGLGLARALPAWWCARVYMLLSAAAAMAPLAASAPNYHGCTTTTSKQFAYCNHSLAPEDRAMSLIKMLTLEEKVRGLDNRARCSPQQKTHGGGGPH
jgi:hypothetical protein